VRGGADIIQLRHKTLPRGELLTLARRLRELIRAALFVVNDHVDIAVLSGADGVHLGPDDLSIGAARRVGGDRLLIGASASTAETARAAFAEGADYIGCGATFATPVKGEKKVIGPQGVALVVRARGPAPTTRLSSPMPPALWWRAATCSSKGCISTWAGWVRKTSVGARWPLPLATWRPRGPSRPGRLPRWRFPGGGTSSSYATSTGACARSGSSFRRRSLAAT